jgi:hypothetical protein
MGKSVGSVQAGRRRQCDRISGGGARRPFANERDRTDRYRFISLNSTPPLRWVNPNGRRIVWGDGWKSFERSLHKGSAATTGHMKSM